MKNRTIHVLSIEDNLADADLIQEKLAEAQQVGWGLPRFEVENVARLKEALARLGQGEFDVVLTDLDLPDSRAGDTVATLREHIPHMPLVVLTGREDEALAHKTVRAGVQDYLYKNEATGSLLARTMMYAIERQQVHDELERQVRERTAELERANRKLEAKIVEHEQTEMERDRHIRGLQLTNDAIIRLSRMQDVDGMCDFAAEWIRAVNPQAYVVLTVYDPKSDAIRIRTYRGFEGLVEPVLRVLGVDPRKMSFKPSEMGETAELYTTGRLERVGLYELSTGKIPRVACQAFERLLGIGAVHTVGFALEEEPYGGIIILIPRGQDIQYRTMIETIARHLSVTIQHRQVKSALEESERKFRTLFNSAGDAIFIHDLQGRFLEANYEATRRLGYSREELLQMDPSELDTPEYAPLVLQRIARIKEEGHAVLETVHRTRDGRTIPIELSSRMIHYEGGLVILSIARDITERKQAEEELRRHERLAAVGQLAAGIAHDFRNLLTTIILYAKMGLRRPDLSPKLAQSLETIIGESKKAADLVQQILDFSGRTMVEMQPLDLKSLTSQVIGILRRTIPENVRLTLTAGTESYMVLADPGRIQQALMNLALNSRDAMPEGGGLRFELSRVWLGPDDEPPVVGMRSGEYVCLAIVDTGTGMTDEVRAHLFEPFFTTKEVGQGTGLGLAQVYGIVRVHEGYVGVETEVGAGTTFRLYLPASEAREAIVGQETPAAPPGQGETILLVEDEEKLREAVRGVLASLGYRMLTAMNGRHALEVYEASNEVDLVITDVVMPEMGGKELVRALRRREPNLKALGITGYMMKDVAEDLKAAGFLDVIHKPFDPDDIARMIRRALDAD